MSTYPDANQSDADRYTFVEYEGERGTVSVVQDVQNERAWIQSTTTAPVER